MIGFRRTRSAAAGWGATLAIAALALASCSRSAAKTEAETSAPPRDARPNVVWILLDGCRASNLSAYGYERFTSPNLKQLASEGALFRDHYAQSGQTYRSVPSYMTGRYFPVACFDTRFANTALVRVPPADEQLAPSIFRKNGYDTAMFTNMPLFSPKDRLWSAFDEVVHLKQGEVVLLRRWAEMEDRLNGWLERHTGNPFFLYIHAADTHFPHEMLPEFEHWIDPKYDPGQLSPMGYGQNYQRKDGQPFTPEDREYLRSVYDGMLLDADTQVGKLIGTLKRLGLYENTIIVVNADHGQYLGEDGYTVAHHSSYDQVLQIPLIMAGPGIPAGTKVDRITENVDVVPSLVALTGVETTAHFDGLDLSALWADTPPQEWRSMAFAAVNGSDYDAPPSFVLRGEPGKLEWYLDASAEHLWRVPDLMGRREELLPGALSAYTAMKQVLDTQFMPRWEAYKALPIASVYLDAAWMAQVAAERDAVEDQFVTSGTGEPEALRADGKWAYTAGRLWSCAAMEDAPPLTAAIALPAQTYHAELTVQNNSNWEGFPGSRLRYKWNGEAEWREVTADNRPAVLAKSESYYVGDVAPGPDGVLRIALDDVPGFWAALYSIRLTPVTQAQDGPAAASPSDIDADSAAEQQETLRAMGYF